MILDKNLVFTDPNSSISALSGNKTVSREIVLGQDDLAQVPNNGMGPYEGLYLCVIAANKVTNLTVTVEHSDIHGGTYSTLVTYPAKSANAGEFVVKAPLPFSAKNWLRLKFSSSVLVHSFLTTGVDKGVVVND